MGSLFAALIHGRPCKGLPFTATLSAYAILIHMGSIKFPTVSGIGRAGDEIQSGMGALLDPEFAPYSLAEEKILLCWILFFPDHWWAGK